MKQIYLLLMAFLCPIFLFANGVGIIDGTNETYLELQSSGVQVSIENQVAVVTTVQTFYNTQDTSVIVKYGFPLPENATSTSLRWQYDSQWHDTSIAAEVQDTIIPGSGSGTYPAQDLTDYLGNNPLYYDDIDTIAPNTFLKVELQYVQLLPYEFGVVSFFYPNDYFLIQQTDLNVQSFELSLTSERTIENLEILDIPSASVDYDDNDGAIYLNLNNEAAQTDYQVNYSLSLDELGLYDFSTMLDESLGCDDAGEGYMAFIVEPDASENTEVINKVFTFVIDRSGSMNGEKIVQARNAASFIINNLNEGDYFNIVDFSGEAKSFQDNHVPFNGYNQLQALEYIDGIDSGGGTNMVDAFSESIPQFNDDNGNTYNILIFLTDGQGNDPDYVTLAHVEDLVSNLSSPLNIFSFGIGTNVNTQFLTQLATQNTGIPYFLGNEELEEAVSYFYLTIQNPVLLNTQMSFSPNIITEIYPQTIPNLYKGQQLLVVGRYANAEPVEVTFSGTALGQEVVYNYTIDLANTQTANLEFLPKLWSKQKIESLTLDFYNVGPYTTEGMALEEDITDLSVCHGVTSIFTSFQGGDSPVLTDPYGGTEITNDISYLNLDASVTNEQTSSIISNAPNPFTDITYFTINTKNLKNEKASLNIYDVTGKLVCVLEVLLDETIPSLIVAWNGKDTEGRDLSKGQYFYSLQTTTTELGSGTILKQ